MSVVCKAEPGETERATAHGLRLIVVKEEDEEETVFKEEGLEGAAVIPGAPVVLEERSQSSEVNQRVNYNEREGPKDEHFLYCEECKNFFLGECQLHGPPIFIPDTPVDLGVSDRARLTLPHGLEFRRSQIPGAGLGVFNCGEEVPKGTHYGPFEGEVMEKLEALERGDCWVIRKSRNHDEYISAKGETQSNWMRYVKCARTEEEQNLVACQYNGGILYRCCRPVAVGEELLVWYGQEYIYKSIFFQYFWDTKNRNGGAKSELSQTPVLFCSTCRFSCISQIDLHKHVKKTHKHSYGPETCPSLISLPSITSNAPLISTTTSSQGDTDGLKLFHCDQSGKNLRQSGDIKTHLHVPPAEKLYHCDQCGKNFTAAGRLIIHQRVHTTEKPYHCDHCGKIFTKSANHNLLQHVNVQTGEVLYHCDQCGKDFTEPRRLIIHQRVHTGEKPYSCDQCGKNFATAGDVTKHRRIHYKGVDVQL